MALTFLQETEDTSDLTTYTFSDQNLGTASTDRYIICTIHGRGVGATTRNVTSASINGVSANVSVTASNAPTNATSAAIVIAKVPTGTTGDVVITWSSGLTRCDIGLWAVTEISDVDVVDSGSSTASDPTYDIDCPAGGVIIGASMFGNTSTTTWTGITKEYDITNCSGAGSVFESEQTNLTITANGTSSNEPVGVFASWKITTAFIPQVILI